MPNFTGLWSSSQQLQARASNIWPAVPGAPTGVTATAGASAASVAFTAPTDTGYPTNGITSYTVTSSPGGFTATGASSPLTVVGLTIGTSYTFTVRATNATGTGPASSASGSATPFAPSYIEDVFSTTLYNGNGSTQNITNGIDLAGNGGLVWTACRSNALGQVRQVGTTNFLNQNADAGANPSPNFITSFNNNGFSIGAGTAINNNGSTYVSWTFREQPRFFDVVTWTGNGVTPRTISHNLGSTPGCIMIKRTDSSASWTVWHRASPLDGNSQPFVARLNSTVPIDQANEVQRAKISQVTSTTFQVLGDPNNAIETNISGGSYVAYIFAHNAGGFGDFSNDNIITCGSFTAFSTVNLGWEPQWILAKRVDSDGDWLISDVMRGWDVSTESRERFLLANNAAEESLDSGGTNPNANCDAWEPTSTGFRTYGFPFASGGTFIYIAIRRPMKVPTVGTSVLGINSYTGTGTGTTINTNIVPDMQLVTNRDSATNGNKVFYDRLRGGGRADLLASSTSAETYGGGYNQDFNRFQTQIFSISANGYTSGNGATYISYALSRARGFFDVVCYTGTGGGVALNHNLGVIPELVLYKARSTTSNWFGTRIINPAGGTNSAITGLSFNSSNPGFNFNASSFGGGGFTATTIPSTGAYDHTGNNLPFDSGVRYVAYLFASCPGVSKVGNYTGNGSSQTINCGFASGARFVMIKRTDSSGDWYVWDTARGIVTANDPYLTLNSTASEVGSNDSIDPDSSGFIVNQLSATNINVTSATYIFLAIA